MLTIETTYANLNENILSIERNNTLEPTQTPQPPQTPPPYTPPTHASDTTYGTPPEQPTSGQPAPPAVNQQPESASTPSVVQTSPVNASQGLAITSLVLGIIALLTGWILIGGLFGIIAIILGAISLIKKRGGKAMSIIGIVLGSLGLMGALIFVPIYLISYNGVQERAREVQREAEAEAQMKQEEAANPYQSSFGQDYYQGADSTYQTQPDTMYSQ